ncbi:hypothetical protein N7G274_006958 [Stereocaulon virgatum]|uniref:Uncharacterized protein n=1 Tax=Stereocaulon virgatum TaxID=373712 RepID=A0ABR4A2F4_9LECA
MQQIWCTVTKTSPNQLTSTMLISDHAKLLWVSWVGSSWSLQVGGAREYNESLLYSFRQAVFARHSKLMNGGYRSVLARLLYTTLAGYFVLLLPVYYHISYEMCTVYAWSFGLRSLLRSMRRHRDEQI